MAESWPGKSLKVLIRSISSSWRHEDQKMSVNEGDVQLQRKKKKKKYRKWVLAFFSSH